MPELMDSADIIWTRTGDEIRGTVVGGVGGGGGITDHGNLNGLADDDHPQYLTVARHATRARHDVSVLDTRVGMTLYETSPGVWSGAVPARSDGENPILMIGTSDPEGANGPVGQANIQDGDVWRAPV